MSRSPPESRHGRDDRGLLPLAIGIAISPIPIESFTFGKALGLGLLLSAVDPKKLLMCLGAGTTIGAAHLSTGDDIVVGKGMAGLTA